MSPEAQRVAIAEALGWTEIRFNRCHLSGRIPEFTSKAQRQRLPIFTHDLNAMAKAEAYLERIRHEKGTEDYREILSQICNRDSNHIAHAHAAQRAEAFLETLGLWSHGGKET